jgi:RNA polymerase sigma-70 factor (ECF subfamily)
MGMDETFAPAGADMGPAGSCEGPQWRQEFVSGSRRALRECYVEHFATVERAVGRVLAGADRETVIHEVFYRLLTDAELRAGFRGGSLRAWIATVARNAAIDYWRRQQRETPAGSAQEVLEETSAGSNQEAWVDARRMIEQFRNVCLPEKWRRVFDARFVEQLDKAEAARTLGMHRSTLVYQEFRIRKLLEEYLVRTEVP